jgi:hypothetical protein
MRSGCIDRVGESEGRTSRGKDQVVAKRTSTAFNAIGNSTVEPAPLSHQPGKTLPQIDITGKGRTAQDNIAGRRSVGADRAAGCSGIRDGASGEATGPDAA